MLNVGDAYISMTVDRRELSQAFAQGKREATAFGNHIEKEVRQSGKAFSAIGEMARGVFQGIGQSVAQMGLGALQGALGGVSNAVLGLNNEAEGARARINAFTKDGAKTAEILEMIRARAAKTPFAFSEMAEATGALIPVAKSANLGLEEIMQTAEILAASNPMQGLEGASFSLREAMTGDFASIIERFNLSRSSINKWKEEGLSNFEIVQRAMAEMGYDADLVGAMGETMSGRWSTLNDTLDQFKITATSPIFDVLKNGLVTVQGYIDDNTESITKYAGILGNFVAKGMSTAGNAAKGFADNLMGVNSLAAKGGTPIEQLTAKIKEIGDRARDAFATAKEFAGGFFGVIGDVLGGIRSIYEILILDDFRGGGPFSEDSPIVVGLFNFRELIEGAIEKYEELRGKLSVPLPGGMGDAAGSAAGAMAGLGGEKGPSGAATAGGALAVAGLAAGALALGPALAPITTILGNMIGMLPALVGAINPVTLTIGALALAAGGLYLAWNNNFLGIRDTVNEYLPEAQSAIEGFKEWFMGAFADVSAATEPLRTDFLAFWTNELRPALVDFGTEMIAGFDRVRDAVVRFAESEGLRNFQTGVANMVDTVMPHLITLGGLIREDLGPAILTVIRYGKDFAREFSLAAENIIDGMGPFFGWIGTQLTNLSGFMQKHGDTITGAIRGAWDVITGIIEVAWALVSGIVMTGLKVLQGDWDGAWNTIKQTAQNVWDGIQKIIDGFITTIKASATIFLDGMKTLWDTAWTSIRDRLNTLSGEIRTNLENWSNGLATWLDNKAASIQGVILKPFEGARDAIGGIMSAFVDKMKAPLNTGISGFNKFGGGMAGVLAWIAGKLGIEGAFTWTDLPALATGTGPNWSGGWAWVGEGKGGDGAELAYLAKGSHVIPHKESLAVAQSLGINPPTKGAGDIPGFALGLDGIPGLGGLVDFFKNGPEKVVELALNAAGVSIPNIPGVEGGGGKLFDLAKGWVTEWVKDKMSKVFPAGGDILTQAIEAAEAQLGKEYQWGGNGNPSFDCSGFVKYITELVGLGDGMPRVVSDIYQWANKGRHPLFTFGFQNPTNPDPRVQHMGIGIAQPGGGTRWFEAGGRVRLQNGQSGIGETSDYWTEYGFPPGLDAALASRMGGPGGAAPWNQQAPEHVIKWLLSGLAGGGGPASWLTGADIIAYHESSYNPNAINLEDENARRGDPSKGLMQVISAHFRPGENPFDPIDNVTAATRYIRNRYKDMYNVPGPKSVLAGGDYKPYAKGGVIDEKVIGVGMETGVRYLMGEVGREVIIPEDRIAGVMRYVTKALTTGRFDSSLLAGLDPELQEKIRGVVVREAGRAHSIAKNIPGINPITGKPFDYTPSIGNAPIDTKNLPGGPGKPIPGVDPVTGTVPLNPITGKPYDYPLAPGTETGYKPGGPGGPGPIPGVDPVTGKVPINPITGKPFDYIPAPASETGYKPGGPGGPKPIPGVNPVTGKPIVPPGINPITGKPFDYPLAPKTETGYKPDAPGGPGPIPGVNPVTGKPYTDVPGSGSSPATKDAPKPPGTTGAGGKREIVIRVVSNQAIFDGARLAQEIVSNPIGIEDIAEGVTEIQATWESGNPTPNAPATGSGYKPGGKGGPRPVDPSGRPL